MRRAGWWWTTGSTLLIAAGVARADDRAQVKPRRPAAVAPTQLTAAQVAQVVRRAASLRKQGRLDHAVSLLQRSILLTDTPEPRLALASAHDERARLYRSFAEADKRRRADYTVHAQREAAAAERLRAQARQLAFDRVDADRDGRVSESEGAALLRRLRGRRGPQVKLAGLSDVDVAVLAACADAAAASGETLEVSSRSRAAIRVKLPADTVRAAAYRRAIAAQLRRRGVNHTGSVERSAGRLKIELKRP